MLFKHCLKDRIHFSKKHYGNHQHLEETRVKLPYLAVLWSARNHCLCFLTPPPAAGDSHPVMQSDSSKTYNLETFQLLHILHLTEVGTQTQKLTSPDSHNASWSNPAWYPDHLLSSPSLYCLTSDISLQFLEAQATLVMSKGTKVASTMSVLLWLTTCTGGCPMPRTQVLLIHLNVPLLPHFCCFTQTAVVDSELRASLRIIPYLIPTVLL